MAICSIKLPGTMATQPRYDWADSTACRPSQLTSYFFDLTPCSQAYYRLVFLAIYLSTEPAMIAGSVEAGSELPSLV